MKRIATIFFSAVFLLNALSSFAQATAKTPEQLPTVTPRDSLRMILANKTDTVGKAPLSALAAYMRGKFDPVYTPQGGTITINGSTQAFGSNPMFTIGSGGAVNLPMIILQNLGIVGDGVTNNEHRLQVIIDSVGALGQGGLFIFPVGHVKCWFGSAPTNWDTEHIRVAYNNIKFKGQGMYLTYLDIMGPGGLSPETHWFNVTGGYSQVVRGYAIREQKRVDDGKPLVGFSMSDMTVNGNCLLTGNNLPIPADPATGDGWDVTNKLFYAQSMYGSAVHDVSFFKVRFQNAKGELVYGQADVWNIDQCEFDSCNASEFSVGGHINMEDCWFYNSANAGYECWPGSYATGYIHSSRFYNTTYGVVHGGAYDNTFISPSPFDISGNWFYNCPQGGLMLTRQIFNVDAHDNFFFQSPFRIEPQENFIVGDIKFHNNTLLADTADFPQAISINANAQSMKHVYICNNTVGRTFRAVALGKVVQWPVFYYGPGIDGDVNIFNNVFESSRYPARGGTVTVNPMFRDNIYKGQTDLTYILTNITTPGQAVDPQSERVALDGPSAAVTPFTILTNQVDGSMLRVENYGSSAYLMLLASDSHLKMSRDVILGFHDYVDFQFNGLIGKWEFKQSSVARQSLTAALKATITSATPGLEIFQTDGTAGVYIWKADNAFHFAY